MFKAARRAFTVVIDPVTDHPVESFHLGRSHAFPPPWLIFPVGRLSRDERFADAIDQPLATLLCMDHAVAAIRPAVRSIVAEAIEP